MRLCVILVLIIPKVPAGAQAVSSIIHLLTKTSSGKCIGASVISLSRIRKQAEKWSGAASFSAISEVTHFSGAYSQRGANGQPWIGFEIRRKTSASSYVIERLEGYAFGALLGARIARMRISLVNILSPGFGDANVATQHKQSNRRNRGRQSEDKPHYPGTPRTVFWTKRS